MNRFLLLAIAFTLITNTLLSQNLIKGLVKDYYSTLPQASIQLKNTDYGVIADDNGNFEIQVRKTDTLIISYVGYQPKEILASSDFLEVELESDMLDEVIVTTQGIKREKKAICLCYSRSCGIEVIEDTRLSNNPKTDNSLLYPNPSSNGIFKLNTSSTVKEVQLAVYDITGKHLFKKQLSNLFDEPQINLSRFPTGMYLIEIIADRIKLPTLKALRK